MTISPLRLFFNESAQCAAPFIFSLAIATVGRTIVSRVSQFIQESRWKDSGDLMLTDSRRKEMKKISESHSKIFYAFTLAIGFMLTTLMTLAKNTHIIISMDFHYNHNQIVFEPIAGLENIKMKPVKVKGG